MWAQSDFSPEKLTKTKKKSSHVIPQLGKEVK